MKRANPQGKGLVPALEAWNETSPQQAAVARPAHSLLSDYCASSLVLGAQFDFRPVAGNSYHLYQCGEVWRLSLIAPQEWGARRPGVHVARCDLRHDMTWSLTAAEDLAESPHVVDALRQHMDGFLAALDTEVPLADTLPFYVSELSFYPRLLASALARSLRSNLQFSGLESASGRKLLVSSDANRQLLQILPDRHARAES